MATSDSLDSVQPINLPNGQKVMIARASINDKPNVLNASSGPEISTIGVTRNLGLSPTELIIVIGDNVTINEGVFIKNQKTGEISVKQVLNIDIDSKPIADEVRGALQRAMKGGFTLEEVKQLEGLQEAITKAASNDRKFSPQETTDIVNLANAIAPNTTNGRGGRQ